uniref:vomeronasal type-1 receptor 4-like n=1 Tax=Jaculus jaculus TaxID=51337 RepID=UPI001E1B3794|nr:vomeronasal type-1 receptor 4-like [Jaculus jaculus]
MFPSDMILGIFLISQFSIGIIGNMLLFLSSVYTFLAQHYLKKSLDSILMHLTMANTLTIVFTLIPGIISTFGVRHFFSDDDCKAVLYIYRVTRGVSIFTTSFLSTFQAITISPNNSKWAWLKPKLSTWTPPFFLFSWLINMLIYTEIIEYVIAKNYSSHVGQKYFHAYCQIKQYGDENSWSFLIVILTRDLLLVVLMMSTSLYMVSLLCRHRSRTRHVHSHRLSSQPSPETKATHSILLLVSCFVFFYWLNNLFTLYRFYMPEKISRLQGINAILSSCYPTISPFILMRNNRIILPFTLSLSMVRSTCIQNAFSSWSEPHIRPLPCSEWYRRCTLY